MRKIGIFFGSDTGNTEKVTKILAKNIKKFNYIPKIYNIAHSKKEHIENFDILLFGIPTWYYGEAQCDWYDFFRTLKKIDFTDKYVAIFGCGDQEDYPEYFCDAMGILKEIVAKKGAKLIGKWPIEGYIFQNSKALEDKENFVGLAIDEDRQPELTDQRIKNWIKLVLDQINL
ncbi:flavodoxin FldA [Candidatus Riesia pediculischaeffi]|uniref:Flavodoxin n=2 Tax=Candidatus Riesia pediculischaeffi TaxID=428411 RepID=A0A1V0HKU9_9ENTR|nr:flavodoxin FldA [Candidatus Riesia pediculischaeffi]ARC53362.1 flavodoxin FldA [Candidatus Riesia pediculischaeffi]KIE63847.1 Flavodoxin 1 [Candidatus Riesia pediculischaeffi PTSU]